MSSPLVSIVTPSYNQAAYLGEAIESVLAQDYPRLELHVVDGGSTDGSDEIARGYADRLASFAVEPGTTQVESLAMGLARAQGEIIGWLNSDDVLKPRAVSRVVAALEDEPELLFAYGDNVFIDEQSRTLGPLPAREWDPPAMVRTCENHVPQPGTLVRRGALARETLQTGYYFFDFQLWLRLSAHGGARRLEGPPLAGYRFHAASKSAGAPLEKARDYVRLADEFFATPELPPHLQPYAGEGIRSAYRHAAMYFYDGGERRAARHYALRSRNWPILLRALLRRG
jgi:glycosyltransferase involved in cell wall biosynthesis